MIGTNSWMLYLFIAVIMLCLISALRTRKIFLSDVIFATALLCSVSVIGYFSEVSTEAMYELSALWTFLVVTVLWFGVTFALKVALFDNDSRPLLAAHSNELKWYIAIVFYCIPMAFVFGAMVAHRTQPTFSPEGRRAKVVAEMQRTERVIPKPANGKAAIVFYRSSWVGKMGRVHIRHERTATEGDLIVSLPSDAMYYYEVDPGTVRISSWHPSAGGRFENVITAQPNTVTILRADTGRDEKPLVLVPYLRMNEWAGMRWVNRDGIATAAPIGHEGHT